MVVLDPAPELPLDLFHEELLALASTDQSEMFEVEDQLFAHSIYDNRPSPAAAPSRCECFFWLVWFVFIVCLLFYSVMRTETHTVEAPLPTEVADGALRNGSQELPSVLELVAGPGIHVYVCNGSSCADLDGFRAMPNQATVDGLL